MSNLGMVRAALNEQPVEPCMKILRCRHYDRCAQERLACKAFVDYVRNCVSPSGHCSQAVAGYSLADAVDPTAELYAKAMADTVGRPRKPPGERKPKRNLEAKRVCVVCNRTKNRLRDFPRASARCHACRPKRATQQAAAKVRRRNRASALPAILLTTTQEETSRTLQIPPDVRAGGAETYRD